MPATASRRIDGWVLIPFPGPTTRRGGHGELIIIVADAQMPLWKEKRHEMQIPSDKGQEICSCPVALTALTILDGAIPEFVTNPEMLDQRRT